MMDLLFQSEQRAAGLASQCDTITDTKPAPGEQGIVVMDNSTTVGTDMATVAEGVPISVYMFSVQDHGN